MSEADGFIVQLVITFIRNLLKIPDRAATAGRQRRRGLFPGTARQLNPALPQCLQRCCRTVALQQHT